MPPKSLGNDFVSAVRTSKLELIFCVWNRTWQEFEFPSCLLENAFFAALSIFLDNYVCPAHFGHVSGFAFSGTFSPRTSRRFSLDERETFCGRADGEN